jgi:hypothetical protein
LNYDDKTILKELKEMYSELKTMNESDDILSTIEEMFDMAKKMLCKFEQHATSKSEDWYQKNKHNEGSIKDG